MEFPLYFGPTERSLFAVACVPDDGRASGAVVLCPPLGLEGVCVRRTFASLSRALARAGVVALRFDYDGTGDSCGSNDDPDRVPAWIDGVHRAVALARQSGLSKVAVVGMRLGATLAAVALGEAGAGAGTDLVDGLVLWDPCVSGRSYLRAQRALQFFSVGGSDRGDDSVEVPGAVFDRETVTGLNTLDLAALAGPLAGRILVLARETQTHGAGALERLEAVRTVERGIAHGQERLVDVEPFAAEIPWDDVEAVTAWLTDVLTAEPVPVSVPRRDEAIVGEGEAGPIVERTASLGPLGLFGILTEPRRTPDSGRGTGPTAIFLNAGVIDHTGPARLWVELARRWARAGVRSVRCDLSGLGDSAPRDGQPVDVVYPPEAIGDVLDVARAVSPANPADVILVGLCSGGYHAIEGALALGARGVCAINPILTHKPAEIRSVDATSTAAMDTRRQAAPVRKRWIRALPAHDQLGALLESMPEPVWWIVNRVAVEHSPAGVLRRLVDQGVQTFIVSGEREHWLIWRGESRALRRCDLSDRFQHVVVPDIDHELFKGDARDRVSEIVTQHILGTYRSIDRISA